MKCGFCVSLKKRFLCPYCGFMSDYVTEYGAGEFYRGVEITENGKRNYSEFDVYQVHRVWVVFECGDELEVVYAKDVLVDCIKFGGFVVILTYSDVIRRLGFGEFGYFWCV